MNYFIYFVVAGQIAIVIAGVMVCYYGLQADIPGIIARSIVRDIFKDEDTK